MTYHDDAPIINHYAPVTVLSVHLWSTTHPRLSYTYTCDQSLHTCYCPITTPAINHCTPAIVLSLHLQSITAHLRLPQYLEINHYAPVTVLSVHLWYHCIPATQVVCRAGRIGRCQRQDQQSSHCHRTLPDLGSWKTCRPRSSSTLPSNTLGCRH